MGRTNSQKPGTKNHKHGLLVLLLGPSGVGKTVIVRTLRKRHPDWHVARSATTRPRRPREGDDQYLFVHNAEFDQMLREGAFLEWARVHNGARYGTLLAEITPALDAGKTVLREVDVQGLHSIRAHPLFQPGSRYHLRAIFITPESTEKLLAHIQKRAPMSEEELRRRMESMEREMAFAAQCDATVANREGGLKETVRKVEEVIEA